MKIMRVILLAYCCSATVQATEVTVDAAQDTTIFQNNVNNSDGGGPGIFVGANGTGSTRRGLISFNVSSFVPAGAIITNVQLTLTLGVTSAGGPGSATIGLFDLTQNWGQGTNGSTATGIGGTGQGYAANPGDATWDAAFYPSTLWNNPGGDHLSSASASLLVSGTTVGTSYNWLSTPQLVADVQGWLNTPTTNYGWELINADETDSNTLYGFYSSESDNAHFGGSASQVPALEVTYTVPEPASGSLVALTALSLSALIRPFRRRI